MTVPRYLVGAQGTMADLRRGVVETRVRVPHQRQQVYAFLERALACFRPELASG